MNSNLTTNALASLALVRRARVIAIAMAAVVTVALSCTAPAQNSGVGAEAWGRDNCLYIWNGSSWTLGPVCRVFPDARNSSVWDQYASNDPQRRFLFRVNVATAGWVYLYDHVGKGTFALPDRGSWMHLFDGGVSSMYVMGSDGQWYSAAALMAANQQQVNPCLQEGMICVGGGSSSSSRPQRADIDAQLAAVQARIAQQANIILAPACTSSYNGC